jgi:Tripartite tricarboxylate transporter TctB family
MNRTFLRGSTDFYSGLLLLVTAATAIWLISDLDIGSAHEMGPAYFPLMISVILAGMGLILMGKGLLVEGPSAGHIELRPMIFVLLSFIAFGVLIVPAGLILAILAQVAIGHFASTESRPLESLLFGLGLAAFSAVLFVYILRVPVSVLP